MAQAAIDCAVKYITQRKQFGKELYKFQGLQFMLAEMETKLNAARLLVYNAAYTIDAKEEESKPGRLHGQVLRHGSRQ